MFVVFKSEAARYLFCVGLVAQGSDGNEVAAAHEVVGDEPVTCSYMLTSLLSSLLIGVAVGGGMLRGLGEAPGTPVSVPVSVQTAAALKRTSTVGTGHQYCIACNLNMRGGSCVLGACVSCMYMPVLGSTLTRCFWARHSRNFNTNFNTNLLHMRHPTRYSRLSRTTR